MHASTRALLTVTQSLDFEEHSDTDPGGSVKAVRLTRLLSVNKMLSQLDLDLNQGVPVRNEERQTIVSTQRWTTGLGPLSFPFAVILVLIYQIRKVWLQRSARLEKGESDGPCILSPVEDLELAPTQNSRIEASEYRHLQPAVNPAKLENADGASRYFQKANFWDC